MDNPHTHATLGTRHKTKTNKTKNTTQKTNFDPLYTRKQKEQGQICLTNAFRKFHKDSKRKKNGN
jgi:predicted PhzF superfamily epimerase YddE/YHI9